MLFAQVMILIADSGQTTSQARHSKQGLGFVIFTAFGFPLLFRGSRMRISAGQLRTHFQQVVHRSLLI